MHPQKAQSAAPDIDRLIEADAAWVWHPFTPMQAWRAGRPQPGRMIVAGEGFYLIDARGERYIDGFSSLWCNVHGHRVPQIDQAVRDQLDRIAHGTLLGHASPPSVQLAERLVRITPPGLSKVFYSDCGAAAVEVALKMAYQYYRNIGRLRRHRFLALRHGYHGDTIGSVSVGGVDAFRRVFEPLLFGATLVDCPCAYVNPVAGPAGEAVLDQIDAALSAAPDEYCAMILEPLIQAAGGMLTHPKGFLARVREITAHHDVLLIADEVATGFCRTGKLFACDHENVRPDLMCLGKGLTGGYLPVAATLATDKIFEAFCGPAEADRTLYHGHTFGGNALGCAAAVASTDLIFESGLPEQLPGKARQISAGLAPLADHPHVAEVRQCGMMVGIQLVADRGTNRAFDPAQRVGAAVCRHARRHGVITRPLSDVVVLMPAPAMDPETLETLLSAVVTTIDEYFREHPV